MTDAAPSVEPAEVPSAPGSPLANLRQRREAIAKSQVLDLPVPRWDNPRIVVRYKPGEHPFFRRQMDRVEKAPKNKRGEVEVEANSDVLVHSCVGVYAVIDGKPYVCSDVDNWDEIPTDDNGEIDPEFDDWGGFSPELGQTLGAAKASARAVVAALFITDGDVISAAGEVMSWSGYREAETNDAFLGE